MNYRRLYDNFTLLLEDSDEKNKRHAKRKGKGEEEASQKKKNTPELCSVPFRKLVGCMYTR